MRVKLDENLGAMGAEFLRAHDFDVATAADQNFCSAPDQHIVDVCRTEDRCFITLDLDFSNPLNYRPAEYFGIVVVRLPRLHRDLLHRALALFVEACQVSDPRGRLWIAEPDRLREHLEQVE